MAAATDTFSAWLAQARIAEHRLTPDLLDFIDRTFGVRVSRIALYKFLKKFGLDQVPAAAAVPATPREAAPRPGPTETAPPPAAAPAPPFSSGARSTRAPS